MEMEEASQIFQRGRTVILALSYKYKVILNEHDQVVKIRHETSFKYGLEIGHEDELCDQKTALFGGIFKKSSKNSEPSLKAQDNFSVNGDLSNTDDSLAEANPSRDKGGVLKGMFKKTNKSSPEDEPQDKSSLFGVILKRSPRPGHVRRPSQDLLELSASNDSLSDNAKEPGGMFSGMFKKPPKPSGAKAPSQEDLSAQSELSGSKDDLSNNKESGGMLSGMFKKSPKLFGARAQSQEDLSADKELSGSSDSLSDNPKKEKGGRFGGMFKRKGAKSQSQDDLSVDDELNASSENLTEKPSKGGVAAKLLKNPFSSSSQEKEKAENSGDENSSAAQMPKAKQNGVSAVMKSTFYTDKQKSSNTNDEQTADGDSQPGPKQSKLAGTMTKLYPFRAAHRQEKQPGLEEEDTSNEKPSSHKQNAMAEAMSKLNPFRSAHKNDVEDTETSEENGKQLEKSEPVKSNLMQPERKPRHETPKVPPRPTKEEMKPTSPPSKLKPRQTEEKSQSDDEGTKDESAVTKNDDEDPQESKRTKMKKHKHHNPFMPHAAKKTASDDEELKDEEESSSKEGATEEEGKEKTETNVKKPKRHNPFMPRVKAKVVQKRTPGNAEGGPEGNTAESEGASRSLFDQLEDFRIEPSQPKNSQDVEDLMDWWNTVEGWEDTPQVDDMTEKEEAKAFALTAEKVQKGIRVFNKLFSERAESLWQHVINLNGIADALDKFNKKTKIAQITGGSTSAIGGVATIAGLALAPVTMGTSLIVTAVGLGVATAGGLTSAGAGISNQVNNSMDRKKVEKIVEDYQEKMVDLNKGLKFIQQGIENMRRFDLIKMKKHAYNRDFPALTSSFYEDGAMAGKAILINANEIMRVVQIANVAGSTAARAVQIASMATGVLTGLFVGMDIYFVAKDSKELKKGAKSEFAAKIREVATQLHDGLVELNGIREELQPTTPQHGTAGAEKTARGENTKEKDDKYDSSDEDEIDRIKKAIKKDMESREYV